METILFLQACFYPEMLSAFLLKSPPLLIPHFGYTSSGEMKYQAFKGYFLHLHQF